MAEVAGGAAAVMALVVVVVVAHMSVQCTSFQKSEVFSVDSK